MAYKENEVVTKYTKGNHKSDCGEYNVNDLLEMFDEAEITVDEYGTTDGVTVNLMYVVPSVIVEGLKLFSTTFPVV